MRRLSFDYNHDRFEWWVRSCVAYLEKLSRPEISRQLKSSFDRIEPFQALIPRTAGVWELLIERDAIASLHCDSSKYADTLGLRLRKRLTWDECHAILTGHKYLDFKSVSDVKGWANKHLVDRHNPFNAITSEIADRINEFMNMRNFLSHYSSHARRSYRRMYRRLVRHDVSSRGIPEPGGFLITVNPKTGKRYWTEYLDVFLECSQRMLSAVAQ